MKIKSQKHVCFKNKICNFVNKFNCNIMATKEIQLLFPAIREYLKQQPVEMAWLFGSCSRGENTSNSDMDILVRYTPGQVVSLFKISKIMCGLSKIVGMKVDLVEEGRLLPFAVESANHDKLLIYERAH